MYLLLVILMLIASVLMCFIVLIQNSKGGGLASGFSSSNQIMGVRKTTDFLEKATWTLAAVMVVFSIVSAYTIPSSTGKGCFPLYCEKGTETGRIYNLFIQS